MTNGAILDTVASRVYGAGIKRGRNVRIVWSDGRLYIASSPADVVVIATKPPTKGGGGYRALLEDGSDAVTFIVPSCGSCRRRLETSKVGQMSRDAILAAGTVDA